MQYTVVYILNNVFIVDFKAGLIGSPNIPIILCFQIELLQLDIVLHVKKKNHPDQLNLEITVCVMRHLGYLTV